MKILIIEDEAPAYRRLNTLLNQDFPEMEVLEVIDSVNDAIKWLRNHSSPDLIFSDIQLADGLSFEIYKEVEVKCPIIFTTAYDEYMLDAFQTNGIDYLLKPIEPKRLNRSIEKFKSLVENQSVKPTDISDLLAVIDSERKSFKSRFLIKVGTKLIPVNIDSIAYFYSADGSTHLIAKNGKTFVIDQTLDELDKLLDPELFFRLNRQYMSCVSSIESIHQYFKGKLKLYLKPKTDTEVIISREKARLFKNWMDG